jgi:hypothetical protein
MKLASVLAAAALLAAVLSGGSGQGGAAYAQSGGSIAGWVFYDANENGQHEANEPGLEGWYLTLARVSRPDFSEPVGDPTRTDWNGSYRFSDVEAADYLVFMGPMPTPGPQPAPGSDLKHRVTLESGQSAEEVNFRIALPEATPAPVSGGAIEGYVFIDADGDGAMGDEEYGLTGVSLTLLDQDTWAETGIDGRYSFGGLLLGTYRVRLNLVDAPEGIWLATSPVFDPRTGITREVVLARGDRASSVSFAIRRLEGTGIIAGTVFEDSNRNGVRDSGEEGVEPARVALEGVDFLIRDPSRADIDPDGRYEFTRLPAGSYRVFGIAPEVLGLSVQTAGPAGPITLAEGERLDGVDFGFARLRPGSMSGPDMGAPATSSSDADPPDSSSDFAFRSWQIAAAVGSAVAMGGALGAVLTVRRRRARRAG